MAAQSAGILLFRRSQVSGFEVLLAHPGGPLWKDKDVGAWTIPKGLIEHSEDPLEAAVREFEEETGIKVAGPFISLGKVTQKNNKVVEAWGCEGDADPATITSNEVQIKLGGRWITIPEVDRCEWFVPEVAARKLNPAQIDFVVRLGEAIRKP